MTDQLELRPKLAAFARIMEQKLRENDYKGGWESCDVLHLFSRMMEEARELNRAIGGEPRGITPEQLAREAADVANFAMMIADVCGGVP